MKKDHSAGGNKKLPQHSNQAKPADTPDQDLLTDEADRVIAKAVRSAPIAPLSQDFVRATLAKTLQDDKKTEPEILPTWICFFLLCLGGVASVIGSAELELFAGKPLLFIYLLSLYLVVQFFDSVFPSKPTKPVTDKHLPG